VRTNPWGWARHGVYDQTSHDHQIISIFKILSDISVSIISHLSYLIALSSFYSLFIVAALRTWKPRCILYREWSSEAEILWTPTFQGLELSGRRVSQPTAHQPQLRTWKEYGIYQPQYRNTTKSKFEEHIYEIPVITLTSRGGLGTFLFTFFGREECAVGTGAQLAEKPFYDISRPAMDRKNGFQIQRQLRLWQRQLMPLFLSRASPLFP
jgi:hypothetical protein